MRQTLSITIVFALELFVGGCRTPIKMGPEVTEGTPIDDTEVESSLKMDTRREIIINQFGQPEWTAYNNRIICYEGTYDYGEEVKTGQIALLMLMNTALAIASYGYGPAVESHDELVESIEENRRVLILFDEADKLKMVRVFHDLDELEHTKLHNLLEFSSETGLPGIWITEEHLINVFGADPVWRSTDGRVSFFGIIESEYGNIDGVFIRFDEHRVVQDFKRRHFRRLEKDAQFEEKLDSFMISELDF